MIKWMLGRTRVTAALLMLAGLQVHATPLVLQPFEARFVVNWHGLTAAESVLKLTAEGNDRWTYTATSEARGLARLLSQGPVRQVSNMRLGPDGIQPLHYMADDGRRSSERDIDLRFDWEKLRVTGVSANAAVDEPITTGTQDDLSVQIALMAELANSHTPALIKTYGDRGAREYHYSREGTETLQTPLGAIDTVIYRSTRSGSPRVTRYWCAPAFGFLPVRAQQKRLDEVEWTMDIRGLTR